MDTRTFTFKKKITTPSIVDDTVILETSLRMSSNRNQYVRVINCSIPSNISAINELYNTNKFDLYIDDVKYPSILPNGVYSYKAIQNAINNIIDQIEPHQLDGDEQPIPSVVIEANDVVQKLYITFYDGLTKNVKLDFTISNLKDILGFHYVLDSTDALHIADSIAQLDYFGNVASVELNIGSPLTIVNSRSSNELCLIQLNTTTDNNYYNLTNVYNPPIRLSGSNQLNMYKVTITGNGKPLFFMDGEVVLTFEITEN